VVGAIKNLNVIIFAASFKLHVSEDDNHTVVVWDLDVPHASGIVRIILGVERAGKLP
jgi:hypothetical protein